MKDLFLKAYVKAQILRDDHGQDLIEYVLIAAVLSLSAIALMPALAAKINETWGTITGKIAVAASS